MDILDKLPESIALKVRNWLSPNFDVLELQIQCIQRNLKSYEDFLEKNVIIDSNYTLLDRAQYNHIYYEFLIDYYRNLRIKRKNYKDKKDCDEKLRFIIENHSEFVFCILPIKRNGCEYYVCQCQMLEFVKVEEKCDCCDKIFYRWDFHRIIESPQSEDTYEKIKNVCQCHSILIDHNGYEVFEESDDDYDTDDDHDEYDNLNNAIHPE